MDGNLNGMDGNLNGTDGGMDGIEGLIGNGLLAQLSQSRKKNEKILNPLISHLNNYIMLPDLLFPNLPFLLFWLLN